MRALVALLAVCACGDDGGTTPRGDGGGTPDGVSVEARGSVAFRQDYVDGDETPIDAGFGVRFDALPPEVRAHITRYVKVSPPMFREP